MDLSPEGIQRARDLEKVYKAGKLPPQMKADYEKVRPRLIEALQDEDRTLPQALGEGLINSPASAFNFGKNIVGAVAHPIDTVEAVGSLGIGSIEKIAQKIGVPLATIKSFNDELGISDKHPQVAEQFWGMMADRYGSWKDIKKTIAKDPIGLLADASTVLGGAGSVLGATSRAGGIGATVGNTLRRAGEVTDPFNVTKPLIKGAGRVASVTMGDVASRGGHTAIEQGFKAGAEGPGPLRPSSGDRIFNRASKEKIVPDQIVSMARGAVDNMRNQMLSDYARDIVSTKQSTKPLVWTDIIKAIQDAEERVTHQAKLNPAFVDVINEPGYKRIQEIKQDMVNYFVNGANTASDFDSLKQKIGTLMKSLPDDERAAYAAISPIYDAVKATIIKQVPKYGEVMEKYESMRNQIDEVERTLSLKNGATTDTAMRKLLSVMRNNVNTNFGQRSKLLKDLEAYGAKDLSSALAGVELSSWVPRGLGGAVAGWELLRYLTSAPESFWMLGLALLASPKVAGQVANKAGKLSRNLRPLREHSNALFQAGRVKEEEQKVKEPARITVHPRAPQDVLANPDGQPQL